VGIAVYTRAIDVHLAHFGGRDAGPTRKLNEIHKIGISNRVLPRQKTNRADSVRSQCPALQCQDCVILRREDRSRYSSVIYYDGERVFAVAAKAHHLVVVYGDFLAIATITQLDIAYSLTDVVHHMLHSGARDFLRTNGVVSTKGATKKG